ncbi:hypothetical protein [Streptomyces buecherae]|uniref:hypothetical protein n=1 Tax=Streptomyces buecherae TaxID=2763006 RepID=UPI00365BD2AF
MPFPSHLGVFAAVTRHFEEPQAQEEVRLTVTPPDGDGPSLHLSATEARAALYGPLADTALAPVIWQAVLTAAHAERTPHGPWRLFAVWLALPPLTYTAYRICQRLNVERGEVESEMALALLQGLRTVDPTSPFSAPALIRAARGSAWRFARARLLETPSARLDLLPAHSPDPGQDDTGDTTEESDVEITGPPRPEGLSATLRFRVATEHLDAETLNSLVNEFGERTAHRARRCRRRRRVGTLSTRRRTARRR